MVVDLIYRNSTYKWDKKFLLFVFQRYKLKQNVFIELINHASFCLNYEIFEFQILMENSTFTTFI